MQADSSKPCREQGIGRGFLWGSVGTSSLVSPKAPRRFTDTGGQRFYSERQPPPPNAKAPLPRGAQRHVSRCGGAAFFGISSCMRYLEGVLTTKMWVVFEDEVAGMLRMGGQLEGSSMRHWVEDTGGGSPPPIQQHSFVRKEGEKTKSHPRKEGFFHAPKMPRGLAPGTRTIPVRRVTYLAGPTRDHKGEWTIRSAPLAPQRSTEWCWLPWGVNTQHNFWQRWEDALARRPTIPPQRTQEE